MQPNHVLLKVLSSSKYGHIACLQHAVELVLPCSPGYLTVNHCCKLMMGPNSKGSDMRLFGESLTPHSYKDVYQQLLSIYRLFKPMKTIMVIPKTQKACSKEVQRHAGPTVPAQQSTYRPKEKDANNQPSVTVCLHISTVAVAGERKEAAVANEERDVGEQEVEDSSQHAALGESRRKL